MKSVVFIFLFTSLVCAAPKTFTIKDLGTRNLFALQLEGAIEKNIAISRFITGSVLYDAEKNEISSQWEVDLRSLDTQNEMRNLELREQVLKIQDNPILRVQLPAQTISALADEKTVPLASTLAYQYAGKNLTQKAQLKVTYYKESKKSQQRLPGNLLRFQIVYDWNLDQTGLVVSEGFKMIFPSNFSTQTDLVASDALPTDKPIFPEAPKPR